MHFETERLFLRPWVQDDAADLYELAKDPRVGPIAGWPVHTSVENSRQIIKDVLSAPETYAVTLKAEGVEHDLIFGADERQRPIQIGRAIGSIGLMTNEQSNIGFGDTEAEIGYWIGVPFWGRGLIPEAVRELMRYAFGLLGMTALWCGYFDGNEKSKRVQEKCGFQYHHTNKDVEWTLMNDIRTEHITRITKEAWLAQSED